MKLAIISHTEHYKAADGTIVGWGPTITEINHLLEIFDTIYHVAMLHETDAPPSALPYVSHRIVFVPLPALGGNSLGAKCQLLWKAPKVLSIVNKTLKKVDWFQFRAPTGIGVYVIPFLTLCVKTPGWFKYAGNWNQETPPLGYRWQRWMLKQQSRKVTINGSWNHQPKHCITFENPCLTNDELDEGLKLGKEKSLEGLINVCYVGRLERPKGVERIIQAMAALTEVEKKRIGVVHLVGDGPEKAYFVELSKTAGVTFKFHGFLPREEVFEIYKKSQVFLMPTTASEGFPKAIAEAMNFGCIPIVSDVSSISQYIKNNIHGLILDEVTSNRLIERIRTVLNYTEEEHIRTIHSQKEIVRLFTFEYYNWSITSRILSLKNK
ncbi:glycosyltransferase [Formosa maritima]|uniref:Glycosyltransferase n=1 Tax=Formosa maritima TaxID=2592046 RepID=A0A5D0GCC7_9FLAO|nr:glycosyltransferase [Formosa maritima]TYA56668.1 glycosyltransferase [Formosa maritima]